MFQVAGLTGRNIVLALAFAVLIGFLVWSGRTRSHSFFLGVLAGTGLVLFFDIIWVHWIFGLHHVTNHREDVAIEPLFVLIGAVFLWYGITKEPRKARGT